VIGVTKTPSVCIEVRGGVIVGIYQQGLPADTQVCVVDWDGAMESPDPPEPDAAYMTEFDTAIPDDTRAAFNECMGYDW